MQPNKKLIKVEPIMAVLCDDIRKEDNGKPFIIGMYPAGLTVENFDKAAFSSKMEIGLFLALWIPFRASEIGIASVEVQLVGPDPKKKLEIKAEMEINKVPSPYEILSFSLPRLPIGVNQEGELKILFKNLHEADWKTLNIIPIVIKSNISSKDV